MECAVLEDGSRVISQRGFARAVGASTPTGMNRRGAGKLPVLLAAANIKSFIDNELEESAKPRAYRPEQGGSAGLGIAVDSIPKICDVWLKARDAGALRHNQIHLARSAELLMRGLAHVGIVVLVDEATGYQKECAADALAQILEAFIAKELQPYLPTFPSDFYNELFRLRGLTYPQSSVKRSQYFGVLTNDIVYKRLAPGGTSRTTTQCASKRDRTTQGKILPKSLLPISDIPNCGNIWVGS
jgi:P63C domain